MPPEVTANNPTVNVWEFKIIVEENLIILFTIDAINLKIGDCSASIGKKEFILKVFCCYFLSCCFLLSM